MSEEDTENVDKEAPLVIVVSKVLDKNGRIIIELNLEKVSEASQLFMPPIDEKNKKAKQLSQLDNLFTLLSCYACNECNTQQNYYNLYPMAATNFMSCMSSHLVKTYIKENLLQCSPVFGIGTELRWPSSFLEY